MPLFYNIVKKVFITAFFVAAVMILSGIDTADAQQAKDTFIVMGAGNVKKEDVSAARREAIHNFLVTAVGFKATGRMNIDSMVQNFETLNEILYPNIDKFIRGYKVLTGARSDSVYRVMVQATVSIDKVQQQLSIAGIMIGKKSMPRVLFFIAEQSTEDNLPQYWWGEGMSAVKSVAESGMTRVMMEKGFLIIDYGELAQNLRNDTLNLEPELDYQEAVQLGVRVNADVVIVGKAIASKAPNIMGKNIKSFRGTVTVLAFRTDTGKEIASASQTAVSVNLDEVAGGKAALSDAGALAGKDLSLQILDEWQKEIKKLVNIELAVSGTSNFANFVQFRKTLNDISGVNRVQLKEMRLDESVISVDFQGNAKEIADALMLEAFDSFGL